ncbi:hypothetical protein [Actinospica robiniae]|uniref:hypothetical protein n=1 Tax=Actinospica robiniae TaxID=304901 RepID=UPI00040E8FA9|nr:hypothetical protein [Actinospica robiniae]
MPAEIWRTEGFQRWYAAQLRAGNVLRAARLAWELRAGPENLPILWVLSVAVFVTAENRVKENEVLVARPDVSAVALYRPGPTLDETVVVLIREFRSPGATADGYVHELPSGSGTEPGHRAQAAAELAEETGFVLDADRLTSHGSRQAVATLSIHQVHLFSARIDEAELAELVSLQQCAHGDGVEERTWVEVTTFGEILRSRSADWTTLGMLAQVLLAKGSGE